MALGINVIPQLRKKKAENELPFLGCNLGATTVSKFSLVFITSKSFNLNLYKLKLRGRVRTKGKKNSVAAPGVSRSKIERRLEKENIVPEGWFQNLLDTWTPCWNWNCDVKILESLWALLACL